MRFTYQGYEIFDVSGNDDVWVLIDDQLFALVMKLLVGYCEMLCRMSIGF